MISNIFIKVLKLFACIQLLSSCQNYDEADSTIYFVGDSEIANWDLEASFPNRITRNLGHDGMRLKELSFMSIEDENGIVVIEIGINDINTIPIDNDYLENYESIVTCLGGWRTLLLEVMPTSDVNTNEIIRSSIVI